MNTLQPLRYHQRTFDLLAQPYDPQPVAELTRWADAHAVQLPEAVVEWYRHRDAIALLREHSNEDHPYAPAAFRLHPEEPYPIVEFMNENQSCCAWGFALDGSDDPPVLVEGDGAYWQACTDQFSTFIYTQVFDWIYYLAEQAQEENHEDWCRPTGLPTQPALKRLAELYQEEPATATYPREFRQRYRGEQQHIVICEHEAHTAYWLLLGATQQARESLRRWLPDFCHEFDIAFDPR